MRYPFIYLLLAATLIIVSCDSRKPDREGSGTPGDASSPIEQLTASISADSSNASLYHQRALQHLGNKDHNKAMRDMIKAIELDRNNAGYLLTLSDIYLSMGLLDNCAESLERALELDPSNTEAMLKLAEINVILKNYREAIRNADLAIAADNIDPLPHFIKGYTYAEAGDTVNAIKSYLEAVGRNQDYYDAYMQLGLIYGKAGNRLAEDYLNNALNIDPESEEALYALAMFYQEADDAENAIATYNKLLLVDPENVYAHYNLGYVNLVLIGDYELAASYFEKAARLRPSYFEAIYNLGYCYELMGEYGRAREFYNTALEIEVNYDKAIKGLNRIHGK